VFVTGVTIHLWRNYHTSGYLENSAIFTHVSLFILIFRHIFISTMSDSDESSATESLDNGGKLFFVVVDDVELEDTDALVNTMENLQLKKL
jgi:hypothetical protein